MIQSPPMAPHTILLVDDQIEVRRVLRAGLETLGGDLQILDVPSAEEAQLLLSRQPVDLLVTDIRLAGITGLELLDWVRSRLPQVRVILMTGMSDYGSRRQVEQAGPEAAFFKPVPMGPFLEAVSRCLNLPPGSVAAALPDPPPSIETQRTTPLETGANGSVQGCLAALRRETGALAVGLFDLEGRPLEQNSSPGLQTAPEELAEGLSALLSAGARLHALLQRAGGDPHDGPPDDFHWSSGPFRVWAAPVGAVLLLAAAGREGPAGREVPAALVRAVDRLLPLFPLEPAAEPAPPPAPDGAPDLPDNGAPDETLVSVLQSAAQIRLEPGDVAAFWESALETSGSSLAGLEGLSFEQARRLGLAPEEDETDA